MLNKLKGHYLELVIVLTVLIFAGISHGYNMFHFPYYENDEGTYMSQAWSLISQGKLAPYTYWYDHAPAGWVLIAIWVKLTGGFFTFGASVNSGRVLMLLLHIITSASLIYIAKKLSGSIIPGIIAVLLFSLSPLGIYFQRRVLLDNIMVFWVFLSLAILLKSKLKLSQIIGSGVAFGIAVLTKENAVFFIPAFIYIVYTRSHPYHRNLAIVKWLSVSGLIVSLYLVYALLKGEFFPVGVFTETAHVSLITSFFQQLARGESLYFWDARSDFYVNLLEWVKRDHLTIVMGGVATVVSLILSLKVKQLRVPAFLSILFWFFLLRGKLVIDFYVVPLIPFLALNTGLLIYFFIKKLSFNKKIIYIPLAVFLTTLIVYALLITPIGQYTRDETAPQIETINWIKKNLSSSAFIAIDCALYVDLHAARFIGDKVFPNAEWVWKVEADPEIFDTKLNNDWKNIQYITIDHEILKQIRDRNFDFIKNAFNNSVLVFASDRNTTSYINIPSYLSTNGDWMRVYKVDSKESVTLQSSWKYYKSNYLISYGQVIDPQNNNRTTSEGQSYAMLRATWLDDKYTFDGVWKWTQDHLQKRTQDKLFSWLWEKVGDDYKLTDSGSASDADTDIALALLFAYRKWEDESYLISAKEILNDLWTKEVVLIRGHYYFISGSDAERPNGYLVNPSYLSPASYRIFSEVDLGHPWSKLGDDSYYLLNLYSLPPNWLFVTKVSGKITTASKYISNPDIDNYGFDSFRTMWRVALDASWFNTIEADAYLKRVSKFFNEEWQQKSNILSIYDQLGNPISSYSSLSTDVGALSVFSQTKPILAAVFFQKSFENKFNFEKGYWGDKNNYYDQNWAWFGSALFTNRLPNLWK